MATAAAAALAKARRDIQHEFFRQDAVRPDRAIAFDPDRHMQRRVFDGWMASGVIRREADGRYWLDVVAYDDEVQNRYKRLRLIMIGLAIALAIAILANIGKA